MKLAIKASPNAKKSEIIGWIDEPLSGKTLKIRIAAPAQEGKANAAIIQFLAKTLSIPKSQIKLLRGDASRIKLFELPENTNIPPFPSS